MYIHDLKAVWKFRKEGKRELEKKEEINKQTMKSFGKERVLCGLIFFVIQNSFNLRK